MKVDWTRIIWSLAIINTVVFFISVFSQVWQVFASVVGTEFAGYLFGMGFVAAVFCNKPEKEED